MDYGRKTDSWGLRMQTGRWGPATGNRRCAGLPAPEPALSFAEGVAKRQRSERVSLVWQIAHARGASADKPVVRPVSTDPEPNKPVRCFHGHRAIAQPDANRPVAADLLEMQRRMIGIGLQQFECPVGQIPD